MAAKAPEKKPEPKKAPEREYEKELAAAAATGGTLTEAVAAGERLVWRYLEQHGVYEDHHTRTHLGLTTERKLRYCECPICTDARAALNLTD